MSTDTVTIPEEQGKLPFHIPTLLFSIWRWKWVVVSWVILCGMLAVVVSMALAPRSWQAEAILLYKPPSKELTEAMYNPPDLTTMIEMVKVEPNLIETLDRLNLDCEITTLAGSCSVSRPTDSEMLVSRGSWKDGTAADIANTLSQVFRERQRELRNKELAGVIRNMEIRLDKVLSKLRAADDDDTVNKDELKAKELTSYQSRLDAVDVMYEQALNDREVIDTQVIELEKLIKDVEKELEDENNQAAQFQDLTTLNIQAEQLQTKIEEAKKLAVAEVKISEQERIFARKKLLLEKGYIAQAAFDREVTELEKLKVALQDSPQVDKWKKDLKKLYDKMKPPEDGNEVASSPILSSLVAKRYGFRLDKAAVLRRIEQIKDARQRLAKQYYDLLQNSKASADPQMLHSWRREVDTLETSLTKIRSIYEGENFDFIYLSEAQAGDTPSKSYRKLYAIAILFLGTAGSVVLVIGWEFLDTRIKSGGELALKIDLPLLGVLPQVETEDHVLYEPDDELLEALRLVPQHIRVMKPERGAKVMVVSTEQGEGRTTVSMLLASMMGRSQENVLVIDGSVRAGDGGKELRYHIPDGDKVPGLGDFLMNRAGLDVYETDCPNVHCIPRSFESTIPDVLSSPLMSHIMERNWDYDLVLVDGPPALKFADAELMSKHVDAIILVVGTRRARAGTIESVVEKLRATGKPIIGVVLNQVEPMFLKLS